jgi:hypothetical protein
MIFVRENVPPWKEIGHSARCLRPARRRGKGYVVGRTIFTRKPQERGLLCRRRSTDRGEAVQFVDVIVTGEPDKQADGDTEKCLSSVVTGLWVTARRG